MTAARPPMLGSYSSVTTTHRRSLVGCLVISAGAIRASKVEAAAGIGQCHAERPHLAVGLLGGAQEGVALARGEILARAVERMQRHAGLRSRRRRGAPGRPANGRSGHAPRSW